MDEERKEIALIKKEKSDKHWANHEAFQLMIEKARKEKKAKAPKEEELTTDEIKEGKKLSMKEMMAKAKAEKAEAAKKKEQEEGKEEEHRYELTAEEKKETKEYFDNVKKKYDQRYFEKQAGVAHSEEPDWRESEQAKKDKADDELGAEEYDRKLEEQLRLGNEAAMASYKKHEGNNQGACTIEEVNDDLVEDLPPSLEEVSEQQRRDEELMKTKEKKQQEWLDKIIKDSEKEKSMTEEEKKEFIEKKIQEGEQ